MLAVWRDWGMDSVLREAYSNGIVLCGSSAGSICWFEEGVTDSLAGDLTRMACLGFVPGSNCPHYDGERERRPAYHRLVGAGTIGDGIACDDGVGLHYVGGALRAIPSARPAARAYRVTRYGSSAEETPLDVLQL
jgi:peptidase E